MDYTCDKCGEKREGCHKCHTKDTGLCAKCSPKLRIHNNRVICPTCLWKHKCPIQGCPDLKLNRCKKLNTCRNYKELNTCLNHHPNLGICDDCLSSAKCNECNNINVNTWSHSCGQFCQTCVSKIRIDISPITLMKMLPYGYPRKIGHCILIDKSKIMCKRCMADKTVKDYQEEEMWNLYDDPHRKFFLSWE
jgi:hypothetical protein